MRLGYIGEAIIGRSVGKATKRAVGHLTSENVCRAAARVACVVLFSFYSNGFQFPVKK